MAQINSAGIGSGLNVASLIEQIIASERLPAEKRFNSRESILGGQISALGRFRSAMDEVRSAAQGLSATGSLSGRRATSGAEDLFSATASVAAAVGTYSVEVHSLASAHRLSSSAYVDASAPVGAGTLTFGVGADAFSITTSASTTLDELRAAINIDTDNPGVRASVVTADDGAHLILTSEKTGTAHAITVASADGALQGLVYDPPGTVNLSVLNVAADAQIEIEGFPCTVASNTVTTAIPGVTINLKAAQTGTVSTLTVIHDDAAAKTAVTSFVEKYNALIDIVGQATQYNPATRAGGPLLGDALLRGAMGALRSIVGGTVDTATGSYELLAQIGVRTNREGKLTVDETRLDAVLDQDPQSVASLFNSSGGLATRIDTLTQEFLEPSGRIKARTDSLESRLEDIDEQRERLELRLVKIEARYRTQFAALDGLMAQMNATSQYLTQQLGQLSNGS